MDIQKWSVDQLMQLPGCCFGRRWFVGDFVRHAAGGDVYVLGEEELPDMFVIWGLVISCRSANCLEAVRLTIRLGDHVPLSLDDIHNFEMLLKGVSVAREEHELYVMQNGLTWIPCDRIIIESAGRRLAYACRGDGAIEFRLAIGVLISSVPKEVPDWLISGQGKNLL